MRRKPDEYFMGVASEVMRRCNCLRHGVGALIVVGGQIVSAGYSGTARHHENCMDGGCDRCAQDPLSGSNYDTCLCVHAEQNAFIAAARHGVRVEGGTLYTTRRPCFSCLKEAIQAGLKRLVYTEDWQPAGVEEKGVYKRYQAETAAFMTIEPMLDASVIDQVEARSGEHDEDVVEHLLGKALERVKATKRPADATKITASEKLLASAHKRRTRAERFKAYRVAADALRNIAPITEKGRGRRALDIYFALDADKWSRIPDATSRARRDRRPSAVRSPAAGRSRDRTPGSATRSAGR